MSYIYQHKNWPKFKWDQPSLNLNISHLHQKLGFLLGRMHALGFALQEEALLKTLTLEVVKNCEIENEILSSDAVRSSIARKLSLNLPGLIPSDRHTDGVVEMTLDATQHFSQPLTKERLCTWHSLLFPNTNRFGEIIVGKWRNDKKGPMQVVSGAIGREKVHYEAPPAKKIPSEMKTFLAWFNTAPNIDPLLKAGIAHLWFVTIHPFDDGNGRIARALTDLLLARNDNSAHRFYTLSAQIRLERSSYYQILEQTQKGSLDITPWLNWFLDCLANALLLTEKTLSQVLTKAQFWEKYPIETFNERQRLVLNKLLGDFFGKLTTQKWAAMAKCSHDTALRDIQNLLERGILQKDFSGGRSTSYKLHLNYPLNNG